MKRVRLLAEARTELLRETAYYENARKGTGRRFREAVAEVFTRVVAFPKAGAPYEADTRRAVVKGFPFTVVYKEAGDEIIIFAIAHDKRLPGYWLTRTE